MTAPGPYRREVGPLVSLAADTRTDPFGGVLGAGRGTGAANDDIASRTPGARAHQDLAERLVNPRHPDSIARNVRLLRAHPRPAGQPAGNEPPLLFALRLDLAATLAQLAIDEHADRAATVLDDLGARSRHAHHVLRPQGGGRLHLWAHADQPTLGHAFYYEPRTVCNRPVRPKGGWSHADRGAWDQPAEPLLGLRPGQHG